MLVLTRKTGEKIFVGPDICIAIISTGPHKTRIGIEAPDGVKILRDDLGTEEVKTLCAKWSKNRFKDVGLPDTDIYEGD